jgi:hypothetical protein
MGSGGRGGTWSDEEPRYRCPAVKPTCPIPAICQILDLPRVSMQPALRRTISYDVAHHVGTLNPRDTVERQLANAPPVSASNSSSLIGS